jgi:Asp-tRNA(Asn)/Glu-tRNA(Gln) amidotransferase A subunit family amidase
MTDRIFYDAIRTTRGRGSYRGIRPMSSSTPHTTSGINLNELTDATYRTDRQQRSPDESSPEHGKLSTIDQAKKAGVITDAEDKHLDSTSLQIIDDLLFLLEQSNHRNARLANQVQSVLHKRTWQPDDDENKEDARLSKRRDPNIFSNTLSQTSSPSSIGLSISTD